MAHWLAQGRVPPAEHECAQPAPAVWCQGYQRPPPGLAMQTVLPAKHLLSADQPLHPQAAAPPSSAGAGLLAAWHKRPAGTGRQWIRQHLLTLRGGLQAQGCCDPVICCKMAGGHWLIRGAIMAQAT